MIGINIGSQNTKYSAGDLIYVKDIYSTTDFKLNPILNDYLERVILSIIQFKDDNNSLKLKTNENQKFIFSIPDYYTFYQKESLKNILKALDIYNEPMINESTALTMYYGYLNYNELTYENKYIIFIDIGHSKTSFILSEFSRKKFSVKYVENIPFLGGRDINNKLFELCLKKFKEKNNIELKVTGRNKIRLLEEIEKAKKTLTINDEALINVDAIQNEIDFSYEIKREEFEEIIKDFISIIKVKLINFLFTIKKYKPIKVEMAGQLLRIPILQKVISEQLKLPISKTIAMDECHSLGSLLYAIFIRGNKKFQELNNVESYHNYTISYEIQEKNRHFIGNIMPCKSTLWVGKIQNLSEKLEIKLFYAKCNFKDFEWGDNYEIYYYSFDLSIFKNKSFIFIDYKIDDSNEFHFLIFNKEFNRVEKGFLSFSENDRFIQDIKYFSLVK